MLSKEISDKILTIGCEYRRPKGGVAQVLYNYKHYVFPQFKCITNSGGKNKWYKLFKAVSSLLYTYFILIFDKNIQIVHIHTASYNSFKRSAWFVQTAKLFKKKVILHIHGGGFKEYYATNPKWITTILNKCDSIITLSESWKQFYHSITSCTHIYVVENIIAPPTQNKYIIQKDRKLHLLFLGQIVREKGIFDLLEVLHENIEIFRGEIVLHIAGNGQINKLNALIKEWRLEDIVKYEGFVSGTKKENLLYRADAFILPSYIEGLPVSILEAMSYGKPILATSVGGVPEIVKQDINGILFQPRDKKAILKAIIQIMSDEDKKKKMGEESLRLVIPYFPVNVESQLREVYNNVFLLTLR